MNDWKGIGIEEIKTLDSKAREYAERELSKVQIALGEIKKRLQETYRLLTEIQNINIITLYLVLVHHELYVKKYIDCGSTLRLIKENKYGHNIRDLLVISSAGNKQKSIIKKHCEVAESKSKLNNIKYYPDLRYNFSKTKFRDRAVEDVLIYSDNTENSIIRLMVKETVEGLCDD